MIIQKIAVVGTGYVGLPLIIKSSKFYNTVGFDINKKKIEELKKGYDETDTFDQSTLLNSSVKFTSKKNDIKDSDIFIICVPTPVKKNNKPDLNYLNSALRTIYEVCKKKCTIIIESTVYPGVSENLFNKIFKQKNKVELCYSPERINPGDNQYTIENITKVVSFKKSIDKNIINFYNKITNNNTYIAKNIRTAEMAKALENTQRDINIALINEMTILCDRVGISIYDVLDTASTKWNFLKFTPGLVGGHCIPVDPYYLSEYAKQNNFVTKMILSGRNTNNQMVDFFKKKIINLINPNKINKILFLGVSFKKNVSDLRNSGAIKLIQKLNRNKQIEIIIYDPIIKKNDLPNGLKKLYCTNVHKLKIDYLYISVPHDRIMNELNTILRKLMGKFKIIDYSNSINYSKMKNIIKL